MNAQCERFAFYKMQWAHIAFFKTQHERFAFFKLQHDHITLYKMHNLNALRFSKQIHYVFQNAKPSHCAFWKTQSVDIVGFEKCKALTLCVHECFVFFKTKCECIVFFKTRNMKNPMSNKRMGQEGVERAVVEGPRGCRRGQEGVKRAVVEYISDIPDQHPKVQNLVNKSQDDSRVSALMLMSISIYFRVTLPGNQSISW